MRATFWLTGLTVIGQAMTWGVTILVIRLLHPQDYGLIAMATVFIGFLTTLSEMGLGAAIIQHKKISTEQCRQAAGLIILINITLFALLLLVAPLAAHFYNEERLIQIIQVLGVNFIMISIYTVPRSMMMRKLDFRRKSIIELLGNLTNSAVVLIFALVDFGVWALVAGIVSGQIFRAIVYNIFSIDRCLPSFSFQGIRPLLMFGIHMTVTTVLWYIYSQSDVLIGGRVLGKEMIGIYAVSIQLITLPISKITPLISQIGFSASSRMQTDITIIKSNFLKLVRLINTISFPLFIGFVLIAKEAIPMLLGPKWQPAILPMQILSLGMPLRFISALFPPIVNGLGHPHINTGNMIYAILIMPAAFYIGSHWGINGLCLAWLSAFPLLFIVICLRSLKVMQLTLWSVLRTIKIPLIGSMVMALVVIALRLLLYQKFSSAFLVAIMIAGGAAAYGVAVFSCNREILKEIKSFAFAR